MLRTVSVTRRSGEPSGSQSRGPPPAGSRSDRPARQRRIEIFGPRPEADYLSVGGWETRPTKQPVCIRDRADRRLVEGTGGVGGGVENGGGVSGGRRLKAEVDLEEGEMWKVEGDS